VSMNWKDDLMMRSFARVRPDHRKTSDLNYENSCICGFCEADISRVIRFVVAGFGAIRYIFDRRDVARGSVIRRRRNRASIGIQNASTALDGHGPEPNPSSDIHAERRAEELEMAAEAVQDAGIEPVMVRAVAARLRWKEGLGLKDHFKGVVPASYKEALDVIEIKMADKSKPLSRTNPQQDLGAGLSKTSESAKPMAGSPTQP
jgi:Domain of unknown function (DUF1932)